MALPPQSLTEYHHFGDFVNFGFHPFLHVLLSGSASEFISPVAVSNSQTAVKFYSNVQAVRKVKS
jgi:hypothetical protein